MNAATIPAPGRSAFEQRPAWQPALLVLCMVLSWGYYRWNIANEPWNLFFFAHYFVVPSFIIIILMQKWQGAGKIAEALLLDNYEEIRTSKAANLVWSLTGLIGLAGALCFLELRQPYYFTQDDNLSQFLPTILQACRSGAAGVFPTWNPQQFLGSPTTSVGTYALTYVPTWLSYWFSKDILHNEYATIEVFAILHLLLAYAIIYWAVRREGCRPMLAVLAALSCVLSGYSLLVGRSWYYILPVFVWAPLLIICLQQLRRKPAGWRWILGCGLVVGMFAHAGNVQMWAYTLMMLSFAAAVMLWTKVIPLRSAAALASAGLLGIALAAPLLVPELLATRNVARQRVDAGMLGGLPTLFVPVTLVQTWHPEGHGTFYKQYIGQMYYSGTIFCLAGAALLCLLLSLRWRRPIIAQNVWFLCALVSLIFALGNEGLLWPMLMHVPGFSKFRMAYKFLQLFNVFMALAGAVVIERLLRRWRIRTIGESGIFLSVGALLAYHCALALPSFCTFGFTPYPPLAPEFAKLLQSPNEHTYPKVFPAGPARRVNSDFMQSLVLQWPSLFGVFSAEGYDLLVSEDVTYARVRKAASKDMKGWLSAYGVRYVVTYELGWPKWLNFSATPVQRVGNATLWDIGPVRPMAWSDAEPSRALPVQFDGAGATLDTGEVSGQWVTLSLLDRPEVNAFAGHTQLRVESDDWYRIRLLVPPGVKRVRINFSPPWRLGFLAGGLLLIPAALLGGIYRRLARQMVETASTAIPAYPSA